MGIMDKVGGMAKAIKDKTSQAVQGDDVKARHEMDEQESTDAWKQAQANMREDLSDEAKAYVSDFIGEGEEVIYSVRSSPSGERSQLVLTNHNLYIIAKGIMGGQSDDTGGGVLGAVMARGRVSLRIYPIRTISAFEIQPQKGMTVGHFQVLTASTSEKDNESKFLLDSKLGYFKAVLIYRKIRELQA